MSRSFSALTLATLSLLAGGVLGSGPALATGGGELGGEGCNRIAGLLPNSVYTSLERALKGVAPNQTANGGLGNHM